MYMDKTEVKKFISQLNSKKACGYDDISVDTLKAVGNDIVEQLVYLINLLKTKCLKSH